MRFIFSVNSPIKIFPNGFIRVDISSLRQVPTEFQRPKIQRYLSVYQPIVQLLKLLSVNAYAFQYAV